MVFVTASLRPGETVVQGAVNPDEFMCTSRPSKAERPAILRKNLGSKLIKMEFTDTREAGRSVKTLMSPRTAHLFSINDADVEELARFALIIENTTTVRWTSSGARTAWTASCTSCKARPETVKSQESRVDTLRRYRLKNKSKCWSGRAIGQKVGQGVVRLIKDASEMDRVKPGDVLVTDMTDPDWEPVMKRAAAIVTNRGGRTCHAAIIARELGIPAMVGCGNATDAEGWHQVTVSCSRKATPATSMTACWKSKSSTWRHGSNAGFPVKIMMNVGNPELAFDFCQLPNEGVGLARVEFVINRQIGIHPKALLERTACRRNCKPTSAAASPATPARWTSTWTRSSKGVATIGCGVLPEKVIVRMSDFKSNEYANLAAVRCTSRKKNR